MCSVFTVHMSADGSSQSYTLDPLADANAHSTQAISQAAALVGVLKWARSAAIVHYLLLAEPTSRATCLSLGHAT